MSTVCTLCDKLGTVFQGSGRGSTLTFLLSFLGILIFIAREASINFFDLSLCSALVIQNDSMQGISSPPCAKPPASSEIIPPQRTKIEQTEDIAQEI